MAIVTALLLMMIVVITVSGMVWRQHGTLRRLENASSSLQMNWIARGGFEWARLVLSSDAQSSSTDHLGEIWAQGLPQTPLQENLIDKNSPNSEKLGEISGRNSDLHARYNVERLVGSGKVDPLARQTLDKLLQGAGISPGQSATFATRFFLARQNTTCRVQFVAGEPEKTTVAEGDLLAARGLKDIRLSCQIACEQDMTVRVISRLEGSGRKDAGSPVNSAIQPPPQWVSK